RDRVDLCAVEFSTSAFNDPVGDQGASYRCGCVVCAALEAMGGVGVYAMMLCSFAYRDGIEPCRLNENVLRFIRDHCVEAAHNSGERHWAVCIGDDQVVRRELAANSVESFQRFACVRFAHDDLAPLKKVEIECMRGMAHLPQRVVRGIGGVV